MANETSLLVRQSEFDAINSESEIVTRLANANIVLKADNEDNVQISRQGRPQLSRGAGRDDISIGQSGLNSLGTAIDAVEAKLGATITPISFKTVLFGVDYTLVQIKIQPPQGIGFTITWIV